VVQEVIVALAPLEQSKGHRLTVEIDPACAQVVNDAAVLEQIVYSYLSNAIKFTPAGGCVTFRAAPEGAGTFRLEVVDTGNEFRMEDIRRLFVPFQQLDSGLRKNYEGAGLGLALTKRFAEAQGGCAGYERAIVGNVFFAVLPAVLS
jgi:signal transduction histidine kinase